MKSRSLPLSQVLLLLFGSLLLSVNAQSLDGPIRMESPWQSCGADPSGLGLCAVISSEVYQRLQELSVGDTVVFRNLPLKTGGASVSAVMRRFSASESKEDLPLVVLLRGAVFSEEREMEAALRDPLTSFDFYGLSPDSLAFLALSPFGSNGFLEFGNQTYYLSTPFESFDPENPNPLLDDYVISLARTASRFRGDDKWRKFSFGRASVITEKSELGGSHGANAPKVDAVLPPQEVIDETNARIEEYLRTQPKSNVRRTYRVATDVDYQLYQLKGYNWDATASYYYTIVGSSSSIYARDFGSDMVSSFLYIYTFQDSYPYSSGACLDHMTRNWNPSNPSRSFAALLSGKKLGGGIAYYRTLCNTQWAYAVNGDLSGYFPVPLRDYDYGNWDIYVWSHEAGHVWGASHTHELNPPADYCGVSPGCGATAGSIMSYCHTCSNGLGNIYLAFHQYTKNEVWPFIGSVAC